MGPSTPTSVLIRTSPDYCKRVRARARLEAAWRHIRENALRSTSASTKREALQFEDSATRNLSRIAQQLQRRSFQFKPSTGILIARPGKSPRPIVKSPIENRIVQRSILEVLQSIGSVKPFFEIPTSFGGIRGGDRGVAAAIDKLQGCISAGCGYFVRSDIEAFFTCIPRRKVVDLVRTLVPDVEFCSLFESALNTELENMAELRSDLRRFPVHEIGVAQGSCLSSLVGNLVLHEFDREMNARGVTCLRYIDDFLIVAKSRAQVVGAFESAQRQLKQLGLHAYDPRENTAKSEIGPINKGLTFLGCELTPGLVRPSGRAIDRLKEAVTTLLQQGTHALGNPDYARRAKASLAETLRLVDLTVSGWGNQYGFCTDRKLFEHLDCWIDSKLATYLSQYGKARRRLSSDSDVASQRRLLGVHLLQDSKQPRRRVRTAAGPKTEPNLDVDPKLGSHETQQS